MVTVNGKSMLLGMMGALASLFSSPTGYQHFPGGNMFRGSSSKSRRPRQNPAGSKLAKKVNSNKLTVVHPDGVCAAAIRETLKEKNKERLSRKSCSNSFKEAA